MSLVVFLISIFFTPNFSHATEIFENYVSVRAAGMGNAFSAIVDDRESLMYNPAGLTRVEGLHLYILDLQVGTDAMDAATLAKDITSGDSYASLLRRLYGRQVHFGLYDFAGITLPGFGVGAYTSFNLSLYLSNPAFPDMDVNLTNDVTFVSGFAFEFVPNILTFGFTGKRVQRYGSRVTLGASTLASLSNSELTGLINNIGVGYGADLGLNLTFPTTVKPTISAVWKDVGETRITAISGTRAPPTIKSEMVVGFGLNIPALILDIRPAFDVKHLNTFEEPIGKRLHGGIEFAFPALSLRGGVNQGYWTAGIGFDLSYVRVDAATYGVELQSYPGQKEDRRYMVQATIDLNVNPKFNLGKGEKGRFQRR